MFDRTVPLAAWLPDEGRDQAAALLHDDTGTRVALAVMTTDSPSHDYGTNTLRGVFRRLLADLPE